MAGRTKIDRNFQRTSAYIGKGLVIHAELDATETTLTVRCKVPEYKNGAGVTVADATHEGSWSMPIAFSQPNVDASVEAWGNKLAGELALTMVKPK
jgi:hypothetical protein